MKKRNKEKKRRLILSVIILLSTSLLTLKCFKKVNPQNIFIYGSELFSLEDILMNSSLNLPTPLLFVKTNYAEQQLKKNLFLENVSVKRQIIPFGLKILIKTRKPIAYAEKLTNGQKIKGFIDKDGFFIDEEYSDKKNLKELSTSIFGWKSEYKIAISKIMNSSKNYDIEFLTINFSKNGYLILEEKILKKILLRNDPKIIDTQLKTISNIKNKLTDEMILQKIDTIDLTDPQRPKIKVFKP